MTRDQFESEINSLSGLIHFCRAHGYREIVEDMYTADQFDEYMNRKMRESTSWEDFRDFACGVPDPGYDWYLIDETGYMEAYYDDDYYELYVEVYDWLDDDGFFEDEQDEEIENDYIDEDIWNETINRVEEVEDDEDDVVNFLKLA